MTLKSSYTLISFIDTYGQGIVGVLAQRGDEINKQFLSPYTQYLRMTSTTSRVDSTIHNPTDSDIVDIDDLDDAESFYNKQYKHSTTVNNKQNNNNTINKLAQSINNVTLNKPIITILPNSSNTVQTTSDDDSISHTSTSQHSKLDQYSTEEQNDPVTGVYDEVEIEDMSYDTTTELYTYPCPCGDKFTISKYELIDGEDIARCPSCTLIIRVIYDADMFDDERVEDSSDDD